MSKKNGTPAKRSPDRQVSDQQIRAALSFDPVLLEESVCALAETSAELRQASAVVHDAYLERGLIASSPRRLYLGAPGDVAVLVLSRRGEVVGTVAMIADRAGGGLPVDEIYPTEMQALRDHGRSFVEIGMLAVDRAARKTGAALLLSVAAHRLARTCDATDMVIAVHPATEAYYRATMLFERHGDVRTYPGLSADAATILMHLDLTGFAERARERFGTGPSLANPYHLNVIRPLPIGDLSPAARARASAARAAWLDDSRRSLAMEGAA
jgi:hypothetical protein